MQLPQAVYAGIKASAAGKLAALSYYYDTTIPVTDATFEHVVRLELDRYEGILRDELARALPTPARPLAELVREHVRQFLGATLLRRTDVKVTAATIDQEVARVEALPRFKKWCAE